MTKKSQNQKGSVLIMTIGVLAILSALAATFVTAMNMEAKVATNYENRARLEVLAYSAYEYALAVLVDDRDNGSDGVNGNDDDLYDSLTDGWYTTFTTYGAADNNEINTKVWGNVADGSGNDARWIEMYDDGFVRGSIAIKIIDQSSLFYANGFDPESIDVNDKAIVQSLHNSMINSPGELRLDGYDYSLLVPEEVSDGISIADGGHGGDSEVNPIYFSVLTYNQNTDNGGYAPITPAPININTHCEMFGLRSFIGAYTTTNIDRPVKTAVLRGLGRPLSGSYPTAWPAANDSMGVREKFIENLRDAIINDGPIDSVKDFEGRIVSAVDDIPAGITYFSPKAPATEADLRSAYKNDLLNILINFTAGRTINCPTTYRDPLKVYYNYDFVTTHAPVDLATNVFGGAARKDAHARQDSPDGTMFNSLPDATFPNDNRKLDLGIGDDNHRKFARIDIVFKSKVFQVWGKTKLELVSTDGDIIKELGQSRFKAIVDRGINDGDEIKLLSFQWLSAKQSAY